MKTSKVDKRIRYNFKTETLSIRVEKKYANKARKLFKLSDKSFARFCGEIFEKGF